MASENKGPVLPTYSEFDPHDLEYRRYMKKIHLVDSARVGLTGFALLCGLTVLGTSADTLAVYNATHLSGDFHLPLWPDQFDIRPTVVLVIGSSIVVFAHIVSLIFSKVKALRNKTAVHTSLSMAAPFVGFTAVMISMIFFYAVNTSITNDTLQSWSCQWKVASMSAKPHFGTLCDESRTALYLSVILVPVELIVFTVAGYQSILERKSIGVMPSRKVGSPTPSS
ncbi:uncharacterized protein GGS22DRAFT_107903 [Annulohypoxylon maeteangense]|uniref:uncharacterized protein n=1 Tax=Annulohypoxylon maeteangense TaxID=1927788 RepID=UPI0020086EFE|nr:uncharacterized protein GGS22DRAFT_107903 [Annulohypoxylon maeteangense]KAI0887338.1 hypothetical protein GGS22DRAFT_107903 [Annulohypoxylon maeteangense]